LNWSAILNKRENYRQAFDGFDARKVAGYDKRKTAALLADAGIVRARRMQGRANPLGDPEAALASPP